MKRSALLDPGAQVACKQCVATQGKAHFYVDSSSGFKYLRNSLIKRVCEWVQCF